ncbi:MAG TPA: T9SS type A sorting domain-containing protein [Salinivirgaceae bacterium]|nr:T9SS type A sorting domain-containing protein [Salinivirgaceae bacterium]
MKNRFLKLVTFLLLLAVWYPSNAQQWEKLFEFESDPWAITSRVYPFFYDADTGWIVHWHDLYYTTNGGKTFEHVFSYPDSLLTNYGGGDPMFDRFRDVYPISGTIAYLYVANVGYNRILKTVDGGYNWEEWTPVILNYYGPDNIHYLNENRVAGSFFYRPDYSHNFGYSDDGGKTWTISLQTNGTRKLIANRHNGTIWGGRTGLEDLFYSLDSGRTWSRKQNIIGNNGAIMDIKFIDSTNAIIYLQGRKPERLKHIFITSEHFDSIKYHNTFDPLFDFGLTVCYQNLDTIWISYGQKILRSINSGETFTLFQEIPTARYPQNMQFFGDIGYLGTDSSRIYKFVSNSNYVEENIFRPAIKVFPNPAGKELFIQGFDAVPKTIYITSLTGQTLLKLNSSELNFDNGSVKIPISGIADGIYIITAVVESQLFNFKIIISH